MAKRAVAYVADLMFASNIEATLRRAGYQVQTVEDPASYEAALKEETTIVILDIHAGATPASIVTPAKSVGAPVVAFGRHTDAALLRAAREAGCAQVVPRSTFVEDMLGLVERAVAAMA